MFPDFEWTLRVRSSMTFYPALHRGFNEQKEGMSVSIAGPAVLGLLAIGSVWVGAQSSLHNNMQHHQKEGQGDRDGDGETDEDLHVELTYTQVLMFPITASTMLIILFFFHSVVQYALLALVTLAVGMALQEGLAQLCAYVMQYAYASAITQLPPAAEVAVVETDKCTDTDTKAEAATQRKVDVASSVAAALLVTDWLVRGTWVSHNILGCAMCVQFISLVHFPSLRMAALCLSMLFMYDFFWVFYSASLPVFDGKNVMVEVATKAATSPVYLLAEYFQWQWLLDVATETVELPLKLMYPVTFEVQLAASAAAATTAAATTAAATTSGAVAAAAAAAVVEAAAPTTVTITRHLMLGLGDITIPGVLVAYAASCDYILSIAGVDPTALANKSGRKAASGQLGDMEAGHAVTVAGNIVVPQAGAQKLLLMPFTLVGYAAGLCCAFFFSYFMQHPQPALIYIVPACLAALGARAHAVGCLGEVWRGMRSEKAE